MRKEFKPEAWLYPMPVLIIGSYDVEGNANLMNAAWGGISNDTQISICISNYHKTTKNILERKAFTVSVGTADTVAGCDYVGMASGNAVEDKTERAGFTPVRSEKVNAPLFRELPFTLECELVAYYEDEPRLVGEIVGISIDESVLTDGKVDVKKLKPISFDAVNNRYLILGESVAEAFSVGKKLI
ncbi:MAG: flavin reductase family protein [Erysipelotrichaceae bacterium]|nr:flavin reductase family protein [Erysipelotrichaceae bacterium]